MTCKECKDKYEVTRPFKVLSEGHARVEHWGHTPDIHINVKTRLAGGADACLKCTRESENAFYGADIGK
jgi:hypothetical protein